MMNHIVEDRNTTVLCVGRIGAEKRLSLAYDPQLEAEYKERIKKCLKGLISGGVRSILLCRWSYFDLLVAKCVKELQEELSWDDGTLCPLAVFQGNDSEMTYPAPESYLQCVIRLSDERVVLNDEEMVSAMLNNASVLLHGGSGNDPLVGNYVVAARGRGMSAIDLNEAVQIPTGSSF